MTNDNVTLPTIRLYATDPAPNPALAHEFGLPINTPFYPPDRDAGYVDYIDEKDENQTAYFDEVQQKPPKPTAASPHPPELIPDTKDAIAVCLSRDVCKSPKVPIPYSVWAKADDSANYASNVRSNGDPLKRQNSFITRTYGDEPGVGLGVKSGTVGSIVEPITSSPIVRVNGIPVQRHADRCTLNHGNCPGEYCYGLSTDVTEAPDGNDQQDRAWYVKAWDWAGQTTSSAMNAVAEFDARNGQVVTRGFGGLQAAFGIAEYYAGAALATGGGVASATGIGAAPGVPAMIGGAALAVNGYDNFQAGLRQLWSDEVTSTMIASTAGDIARSTGASEQSAQQVENIAGAVQGAVGG